MSAGPAGFVAVTEVGGASSVRRFPVSIFAVATLLEATPALAGMPSLVLTDAASMRLQTLSFFLVVFLGITVAVKRIWNGLRADFPRLPLLTWRRALGFVTAWSLLLLVVLSMISGARELMTPGAWEKRGVTYKLATVRPDEQLLYLRKERLEQLRVELQRYASSREGRLPPHDFVPEIPDERWRIPHPSGLHYGYRGGLTTAAGDAIVAWEPEVYGQERFVLRADGLVSRMTAPELEAQLRQEMP